MSDLYLNSSRYLAALNRQKTRIEGGLELVAWDDDTPGNKDIHCSWGLCSRDRAAWPDAQDHLFPDDFAQHGRVAPLYRNAPHRCPMDRRTGPDVGGSGCFYDCRIFRANNKRPAPTREEAIKLYDEAIAAVTP